MSLVQIAGQINQSLSVPWHYIAEGDPAVLFLVAGSRLYALPDGIALQDQDWLREFADTLDQTPPVLRFEAQPSALSLNIAQTCNLSCSYCYADEGRFGSENRLMPIEIAKAAIARHIREASSRSVSVGFIGGEPLLNRRVLHEAVLYATREAERAGVRITFGITTNGTLVQKVDVDLFRAHPFAITISMDGARDINDALRPTKRGQPSFDKTLQSIEPLLADTGAAKIAARVTLTRVNLDVQRCLDTLVEAGFSEVGVSPLRTGPTPTLCLSGRDWEDFLEQMKETAVQEWRRVAGNGDALRFSNLASALKQLYRGAYNALPCGAAASYVSVSAEGRYYACHRTVGDASRDLGAVDTGPSAEKRRRFVEGRMVDTQEPCRSCWARYLCGGGCHAEVLSAGRSGCDAIRGWLAYCISLYPHVLKLRPDLLGAPNGGKSA